MFDDHVKHGISVSHQFGRSNSSSIRYA
jgi:hypothetical protein